MKQKLLIIFFITLCGAGIITAVPTQAQTEDRLLIKHGELQLLVTDTGNALETSLNLVKGFNGYVLTQEVWEGERRYTYATLTIGVPATSFETVLTAFKTLGTVQDELVTGEDVTDRTVDLDSRLSNLYANQDRVRNFIDQTNYMTETLSVHDQLRVVESEISTWQGQKNALTDRAQTATITLKLVPLIPTPTPAPTLTPTPIPPPKTWQPGDTARLATVQLTETTQTVADFTIYRLITWSPWLILLAGFLFLGYRLHRRRHRTQKQTLLVTDVFDVNHSPPAPEHQQSEEDT